MRCVSRHVVLLALMPLAPLSATAQAPTLVHQQRYAMGTMFDVVVYHPARADAERAAERALDEVVRLDEVMSHFKPGSDLSRLIRDGRGFVSVEPSLYDVIQRSLVYSRRSGGKFDITISPLLRLWKKAYAHGRTPAPAELSQARGCVGYDRIETELPDRIRIASDCVEIDLGAIGKGYAVDRAIDVLRASGIRDALVNAGSSSIASIGAPPGLSGWPVALGATVAGRRTLLLRDASISTSQQDARLLPSGQQGFGDIIDPQAGAPVEGRTIVSVVAPRATESDALSTTLLMLPDTDGARLLAQFEHVSAFWISRAGDLRSAYGVADLQLAVSR